MNGGEDVVPAVAHMCAQKLRFILPSDLLCILFHGNRGQILFQNCVVSHLYELFLQQSYNSILIMKSQYLIDTVLQKF